MLLRFLDEHKKPIFNTYDGGVPNVGDTIIVEEFEYTVEHIVYYYKSYCDEKTNWITIFIKDHVNILLRSKDYTNPGE